MIIYNYDSATGTYVGESIADADPLNEGGWLIPAHATSAEPPAAVEGNAIVFSGGAWTLVPIAEPEAPEQPGLDEVKAALKYAVDVAAELERGKYITAGSGQAMTYIQKATEAAAYLAASSPQSSDYPLIAAEVGITAPSIEEVAAIVNAAFTRWQQIGAAIEAVRLGGKAAIDAAPTVTDARSAAVIIWP